MPQPWLKKSCGRVGETRKAPSEHIWWQKSCLWRRIFVHRHVWDRNRHPFPRGQTPAGTGPLLVHKIPQPPPHQVVGRGGVYFTLGRPGGVPARVSPMKNLCLFWVQTCLRTKIRRQRQLFRHQMGSNGAFWVSRTRRHYFFGHLGVFFAKSMGNLEKP